MITITRKYTDSYEWLYVNSKLIRSGFVLDADDALSVLATEGVIEYKSEWFDEDESEAVTIG